jgi:hypothetical protein
MTETITVAIVAAIGAYIGSGYAFSRRNQMKAPDATAQAYRDLIAALGDLRSACSGMQHLDVESDLYKEAAITMSKANTTVSRTMHSVAFLLPGDELDLVESAIEGYNVPLEERVELADKAIDALRKSAHRLFRR